MKTILPVLLATLLTGLVAHNALAQERLHEKWRGLDAQRCPVVGCGGGEVRETGGETTTVAGELLNRLWNFFSDTSEKIAQANRNEKARALATRFRNKVYTLRKQRSEPATTVRRRGWFVKPSHYTNKPICDSG